MGDLPTEWRALLHLPITLPPPGLAAKYTDRGTVVQLQSTIRYPAGNAGVNSKNWPTGGVNGNKEAAYAVEDTSAEAKNV